ncbi:MAG: IclR family transcriptional regulator [Micrococcus sp.]|nr:IclR family transcriptional regulator [Micrococcus sp.]
MTPATASATENGSRGTSVIVNVLQIVRCFTVDEPLQGVTEIAAQVGLHKSSVSRILATLEQEHVVERDEFSRKYRLGLGLIAVAGPLLANLDVRRVAMEDLQVLAERTRETAALAIWDGGAAVTVEQIPSRRQVKHTSALGSRYTTGLSASVQVLLAAQDPQRVRDLVADEGIRLDESTGVDAYLDRLATVRREGHAVNFGLTAPDEVGIAAPVHDHRGHVVAAVLLAAPAYRIMEQDVPELVESCRVAARRISARLGAVDEGPGAD